MDKGKKNIEVDNRPKKSLETEKPVISAVSDVVLTEQPIADAIPCFIAN